MKRGIEQDRGPHLTGVASRAQIMADAVPVMIGMRKLDQTPVKIGIKPEVRIVSSRHTDCD